ncbi:dephospho-CoA kinase [Thiotrichales bacterium 19S11-10]|nr:dephospho-CoA kinase [Thiotrichales bacterium 19S11-10]
MLNDILCVGLTGGIASGKSTVIQYFQSLNIHTVCADKIAKDVVNTDTAILNKIQSHFGSQVINDQGKLNRKVLREVIFSKPYEKKWLENLLHPIIRNEIKQQIKQTTSNYCVIDIPLLTENHVYDYLDFVVTVDSPVKLQINRLISRDQTSEEQALQIINNQRQRAERYLVSDYILQNTQGIDTLETQVSILHKYLLTSFFEKESKKR